MGFMAISFAVYDNSILSISVVTIQQYLRYQRPYLLLLNQFIKETPKIRANQRACMAAFTNVLKAELDKFVSPCEMLRFS